MRLVFFEIEGWEKRFLSKMLRGHKLDFYAEPLSAENVRKARNADIVSVFIYSKIDRKILSKLPRLKLIVTRSTGYEHIDVKACKKRDITVCNVPYYGENTVAEHTFALILALSRKIHESYVRVLRGNFSVQGLKGFDLKGKTLGVIGAGHIGLHVIRIAKGFGMNVLAYDIKQDKFIAEVLGFEYVPLDVLLRSSDIITLHVPYTRETHHLIDKEAIKKMKRGVILINTARGVVVDTEALIWGLDTGIIAGAGLDVLEGEELIKEEKQLLHETQKLEKLAQLARDHILLSRKNVVFTPHIAFYSQEALQRILETTVSNIISFMRGRCENVVM